MMFRISHSFSRSCKLSFYTLYKTINQNFDESKTNFYFLKNNYNKDCLKHVFK